MPILAAHIDAINVVEAAPVLRLRLHLDLPGAAEQIDVVDIVAAERGLQRLEDIVERHPQYLRLVAIDIEIDRRIGGRERAEDAAQPRVLVGRYREPAHDLRERLRIAAAQILEHIGEAAAGAEADDRRRRQRQHRAAADLPELRSQARENAH